MAITKSSIQIDQLVPGFNTNVADGVTPPDPPVLDSLTVVLSFLVLDSDGSALGPRVRKSFDVWPLMSAAQRTGMTNMVAAILTAAQARA